MTNTLPTTAEGWRAVAKLVQDLAIDHFGNVFWLHAALALVEREAERCAAPADASEAEREHCEQGVRECPSYESRGGCYTIKADDAAELVRYERAAAVEAYKRSLVVEPTADEREHCEQVAGDWFGNLRDVEVATSVLIRERAAADKAGYERGKLESERPWQIVAEHDRRIAELEAELAAAKPEFVPDLMPLVRRVGATRAINSAAKMAPDVLEFSFDFGKTWSRDCSAAHATGFTRGFEARDKDFQSVCKSYWDAADKLADRDRRIAELESALARGRETLESADKRALQFDEDWKGLRSEHTALEQELSAARTESATLRARLRELVEATKDLINRPKKELDKLNAVYECIAAAEQELGS